MLLLLVYKPGWVREKNNNKNKVFRVAGQRGMGDDRKESSGNMRRPGLLTRSKSNLCAVGNECRWKHIFFFFVSSFFFNMAELEGNSRKKSIYQIKIHL